jgi:hypothetical protein
MLLGVVVCLSFLSQEPLEAIARPS